MPFFVAAAFARDSQTAEMVRGRLTDAGIACSDDPSDSKNIAINVPIEDYDRAVQVVINLYLHSAHKHCPQCRYDLKGLGDAGRCPECGTPCSTSPPAPPSVRIAPRPPHQPMRFEVVVLWLIGILVGLIALALLMVYIFWS